LEGENKRGRGVRGNFTALKGLVWVGEQCGNVTLPLFTSLVYLWLTYVYAP
jgi:hypothetical protein